MQSLIEQVRKCADLQKKWGTTSCFILDANTNARFNVNFPALLAHMQAQQAVVDAARSVLTALGVDDVPYTGIKRSLAALEKESNGKG